jgi:formylmethanofuran dehydrogenase subunit B
MRERQAALVLGSAASLPDLLRDLLSRIPCVVIGPQASESTFASVAIDTGVAGIHEGGTALRMDEVPLPLRPALAAPIGAAAAASALRERLERQRALVESSRRE